MTTPSSNKRLQAPKVSACLEKIPKVNTEVLQAAGTGDLAKFGNTRLEDVVKSVAEDETIPEEQEQLTRKLEHTLEGLTRGRLDSRRVFQQLFVIRSYENGNDRMVSIETLLQQFQETSLNHAWTLGFVSGAVGATPGMISNRLVWVVTRMQVQIERYPTRVDVVEVDTWVSPSGRNGMRRDWLIRDHNSGQILASASSTWVMMNQITRRLSRMPDEVRAELSACFAERSELFENNPGKLLKLDDAAAENLRTGLTPHRGDIDTNQHVNNVKYVHWMLESLPASIFDSHMLTNLTVEYRRECHLSDVVESMSSSEVPANFSLSGSSPDTQISQSFGTLALTPEMISSAAIVDILQYAHLLRLQVEGSEIARGRTIWRLKDHKNNPVYV